MPPVVIGQQLLPDKSSPVIAADIGPNFDLLLATRDGKPLPCRNRDGKIVNVSQVAYMTTIDRNRIQHEETELQHKDSLIQLGTSSTIDREFDQWVQNTQGDWSAGMLQRVYTGPNSDPAKYWDGLGLLWPVSDYLPAQPFQPDPIQDLNGAVMAANGPQVTAGRGDIYFLYNDSAGVGHLVDEIISDPPRLRTVLNAPFGGDTTWLDMRRENAGFVATSSGGGNLHVWQGSGSSLFATVTGLGSGIVAKALLGNHAITAVSTVSGTIRIYTDVATAFADITVGGQVYALDFVGDQLIIGVAGSTDCYVIAYSLASGTFTTLARIDRCTDIYLGVAGGGIFIVVNSRTNSGSGTDVRMYLLQGTTLQDIGTLVIQDGTFTVPFVHDITVPIGYNNYIFFAATYRTPGDTSQGTYSIAVLGYDVLRGRLFKLATLPSPGATLGFSRFLNINGKRLGVIGPAWTRKSGQDFHESFAVIVPTLGDPQGNPFSSLEQFNNTNCQELGFVIGRPFSAPQVAPAQFGSQFISSIIDFTSAQPKLYRQVTATFLPLASDASASVALDAWLDQDPARLTAIPDFSVRIDGGGSPGVKRLDLNINRVATKLVYRVTTTGGTVLDVNNNLISAPKLVSVITKAATGWVQTLAFDLAPNLQSNGKSIQDVWVYQNIDHVVAYNFLRQLWRLSGGEVTITLPNGDTGPWLLQDMHFDSPKPFGTVFRADQLGKELKWIATVKLREDIA